MIYVTPPFAVLYIGLWGFLYVPIYLFTLSWLDQMYVRDIALHMQTAITGYTVQQEFFS